MLGLLEDPKFLFDTVATVIEAELEAVPMDVLLKLLDENTPPDRVLAMIPAEYINKIKNAIGDVDRDSLMKIRTLAVKYVNTRNVLLFLRKNNIELYSVFINHPNGKKWLENFINYVLQNLTTILG